MLRALALSLGFSLLAALPAVAKPPKLTVIIVVDSLSSDALLRARPQLKGGLKTLLDQGAYFPYARYEYNEPITAAGHTTLVTGTYPSRHGIVANRLYGRVSGKSELPFADPQHPALEAPLGADDVSPENILVETLADRLRTATQGRGKVVSLSEKARAAIPLAGRLGQAYWFAPNVGKFITGTFYAKEFPAWLRTFNDRRLPDTFFSKDWTLVAPVKGYVGDDDRPYEGGLNGMGRVFPHPLTAGLTSPGLPYYVNLATSPMFGDVLVQLAKAAIEGEQLGKDDMPDLLGVSFSQTDLVEHQYGPTSWEMQDTLLRLDKQVGELVTAAEKAAGKGNVLVVLTADHGGDMSPEELAAAGLPAMRISSSSLKTVINKELQARFKVTADWVLGIPNQGVFLNNRAIQEAKVDVLAVHRAVALFLRTQPGIAWAVTREDILTGNDLGIFDTALKLGFHPDRSADVTLVPKTHVAITEETAGASHYTPYACDQLVPLVFNGRGVKKGLYRKEVRVIDVAPTLSSLLEMSPPASSEGEVRAEALEAR